jgi:hypothetical protein
MRQVEAIRDQEPPMGQVAAINAAHQLDATSVKIEELPVEVLVPAPWQARRYSDPAQIRALAADIADRGQLQPIRIRFLKVEETDEGGITITRRIPQIIFGHQRALAIRELNLQRAASGEAPIHARVEVVELTDEEAQLQTISENDHRNDLTPYERALQVNSARAVLRARGAEDTLENLRPFFNVRSDQPLSWLRTIGRELADPVVFRDAGIVADGDVDWPTVARLTLEELRDAAAAEGDDRLALLRSAALRHSTRAATDVETGASTDGALVTKAPRPSRRGRRTQSPPRTTAELLERGRFSKKLRAPFRDLAPSEAAAHLQDFLPAVAALCMVATPGSVVHSLRVEGAGSAIFVPGEPTQLPSEARIEVAAALEALAASMRITTEGDAPTTPDS